MRKYAIALLSVFPLYGALNVNVERKKCRRARTFSFSDHVWAENEWKRRFEDWKRDPVVTLEKPWERDGMDEFITRLRETTKPDEKN